MSPMAEASESTDEGLPDFSLYLDESEGEGEVEGDDGSSSPLRKAQKQAGSAAGERLVFRKDSESDGPSFQAAFLERQGERRLVRDSEAFIQETLRDAACSEDAEESNDDTMEHEGSVEGAEEAHGVQRKGFASALKVGIRKTKRRFSKPPPFSSWGSGEGGGEEKMHVFLFDDLLLWGKPIQGKADGKKIKVIGHCELTSAARPHIEKSEGRRGVVVIVSEDRRIFLRPSGEGEHVGWTVAVLQVIKENVEKERPVLMETRGWLHRLVHGTLWSLALHEQNDRLRTAVGEDSDDSSLHIDVNARDDDGVTALHYAVYSGNPVGVQILLTAGAEPNSLDDSLMSPLHYASLKGNVDSAALLLSAGADADARDLEERTPLFLAVSCASSSSAYPLTLFLRTLCSRGASTELQDVSGESPLHLAVALESALAVKALLGVGADVDSRLGKENRTPLHCLCGRDSPSTDVLCALLEGGANPNAMDAAGNSALHLVFTNMQEEEKAKAKPEEAKSGQTSAKQALSTGKVHAALLLAGYGCRVDLANAAGEVGQKLAMSFGLNLSDAAEQWRRRMEPKDAVAALAKESVLKLPLATGPGHASWKDKSVVDLCEGCQQAFSFTNRKRHCRRCGRIFCATCTSKAFSLCPRDANNTTRLVHEKVCTACFNSLCRAVKDSAKQVQLSATASQEAINGGDALQAVLGKPSTETEQRASLFEGAVTASEGGKAESGEKSEAMKSGVGHAFTAASQARDKLVERGEKISALANKTEKLQHGAEDFASLTKKLRQKEEAKGWFGFF